MAYTPEPTHPFEERTLPAQLQREFWALFNNDLNLKDYIVGAMPHKAFAIILDGAGTGDPNTTDPVIRVVGNYNIDMTFGTLGINRVGVGQYQFKMRFSQVGGVSVLLITFPSFTLSVDFPTNAITRAGPTRTSFNDDFQLVLIDVVNGIFEIDTEHIYATGGGAISAENTDMQAGDVFLGMGLMSLQGNAGDYPDSP